MRPRLNVWEVSGSSVPDASMRPRLNVWEVHAGGSTPTLSFNEAQTQRLGSFTRFLPEAMDDRRFNEAQTQRLGS